ncbi:MAG TPA: DUF177 domain-containing protein [Acidobacteriota bacterium]|nr:DUF177 domain-containing protein [Acidobacteriota bacterium]
MIIEVNKLLNQKLRIARPIPMGGQRRPLDEVSYAGPVDVDFTLVGKDRDVKLTGTFSTRLMLTCYRCLARFEHVVEQELDLLFIPRDSMPDEIDVELADEDMNIASYLEVIDLAQVIDEQVVLALPMKILCDENCRGICPKCGADLNKITCSCGTEAVDDRLLVLKDIKEKMFGGGKD